jgi:pilus assembly protein CpaF
MLGKRRTSPAQAGAATLAGPALSLVDTGAGDAPEAVADRVSARLQLELPAGTPRREVAARAEAALIDGLGSGAGMPDALALRDLVTRIVNTVASDPAACKADRDESGPVGAAFSAVYGALLDRIDAARIATMERGDLAREIDPAIGELLVEQQIQLNSGEQRDLVTRVLDEMLGLGPLEPLLADDDIADILVNGADQVYVERRGKLERTDVRFRDNDHVMQIAVRIASGVGRRIDEAQPLVDARLPDGSRVNIIAPPLALDGPSISIRKFSAKRITLDTMAESGSVSRNLAMVLKIAARARLNILVAGGTGSGKTTLLNALSQLIDGGERIVTIEDAAELQLQQPHVVRLETRPANIEGNGEITQRHLVKNALRMRPDRIILGEIRGEEALDVLQAMNTGHDGSMSTIHANNPREALTRLENMVAMAGVKLPTEAVRRQIVAAVDLIVHVSRMRDGRRRVTKLSEVVGMEGEIITTQDLFAFTVDAEDEGGNLVGRYESTGLRPAFLPRAAYFGLDGTLLEAMTP